MLERLEAAPVPSRPDTLFDLAATAVQARFPRVRTEFLLLRAADRCLPPVAHTAVLDQVRRAYGGISAAIVDDDCALQVQSAAMLAATELPPPAWVLPGLLPIGLTLLAGKPKTGKSWLVLQLAAAVAGAGSALNLSPAEPAPVLYLALEDSPLRLRERLAAVLAGSPPPPLLDFTTECQRLDAVGLAALGHWFQSHPTARLVIIDTLAMALPRRRRRDPRSHSTYDTLAELRSIAADRRMAILVVHHLRKLPAADPLDAISGSIGFSGAPDALLLLQRARGAPFATLLKTGRDVLPGPLELIWPPDGSGWRLGGPDEALARRVYDSLSRLGGCSRRRDLQRRCNYSSAELDRAVAASRGALRPPAETDDLRPERWLELADSTD